MKSIFFITAVLFLSCHTPRKGNGNDGLNANVPAKPVAGNVPACIQNLIRQFESEEKQNPPRKIISYSYNDNTVYYVTAPCCDFFSDLYDSNCVLIGHPDGGITGRGDGKLTDFADKRTNEILIWKDERK